MRALPPVPCTRRGTGGRGGELDTHRRAVRTRRWIGLEHGRTRPWPETRPVPPCRGGEARGLQQRETDRVRDGGSSPKANRVQSDLRDGAGGGVWGGGRAHLTIG
jgi:hypothetical protein